MTEIYNDIFYDNHKNNFLSEKRFNKTKGSVGELLAVEFLRQNGYEILQTNYTVKFGEIDIIAKEKETTVFVEVKFKQNTNFGYPREMVNLKKQNNIRRVAELYCVKNKLLNTSLRFDVIEIIGDKVTHIKNAF